MTGVRRRWRLLTALVAVLVTLSAGGAAAAATATRSDKITTEVDEHDVLAAVLAADDFLDRHVQTDGRVSRVDQGGDTVSEGQAYAMLLAVGLDDEPRFRSIWTWTRDHLQRDDGLLGWRWRDGALVDAGAASDADLIAAWALGLAGQRFDDTDLTAESRRISDAVLRIETTLVDGRRILVAGPWATDPVVVNPSYFVVGAMSQLWWLTGDTRWEGIAASSRDLLDAATASAPNLPPDWSDAVGQPAVAPDGTDPRFAYDAARAIIQLAADCDPRGRELAARPWPFFDEIDIDRVGAAYTLDGERIGASRHPLTLVAGAAAADAAGDVPAAQDLLDAATALDREYPTYYGSAWIALGRMWLDTGLLGGCG